MNPLSNSNNENPSWIGDGSEGSTLSVDGSSVSLTAGKRGTPFNVRIDDDTFSPAASLYYEVEITSLNEGNLSVGVVAREDFKPGWKTQGFFYNGNLTNGSSGLLIGFGNHIKTGDKVGVYMIREGGGEIQVVFYLNGRCLGVGFRLTNVPADTVFYPCLHLDGKGTVKYSVPESFPTKTSREPETHNDLYSGDWMLKQAFAGPELGEFPLPENVKVVLSFQKENNGSDSYRLSVKVANRMGTTVKLTGEKMEAFDKIQVGGVMSTMMMPDEESYKVEKFLSKALPELFKMMVDETDKLIMTGATAELISERYEKVFEPVAISYERKE